MDRKSYKTLSEISKTLNLSLSKLRTIVARLDIQPTRFPGDLRKLYYSPEQIEKIKSELDFSSSEE